jgi:hypothetical protein
VIAKRDSGQNTDRFRTTNDVTGIHRLLGPPMLFPASYERPFSSAKTKPQPINCKLQPMKTISLKKFLAAGIALAGLASIQNLRA